MDVEKIGVDTSEQEVSYSTSSLTGSRPVLGVQSNHEPTFEPLPHGFPILSGGQRKNCFFPL